MTDEQANDQPPESETTEPIALDLTPSIAAKLDKLPVYPLSVRSSIGDALVSVGLGESIPAAAKLHGVAIGELRKACKQYPETIARLGKLRWAVQDHYCDQILMDAMLLFKRTVRKMVDDGGALNPQQVSQFLGLFQSMLKYKDGQRPIMPRVPLDKPPEDDVAANAKPVKPDGVDAVKPEVLGRTDDGDAV